MEWFEVATLRFTFPYAKAFRFVSNTYVVTPLNKSFSSVKSSLVTKVKFSGDNRKGTIKSFSYTC